MVYKSSENKKGKITRIVIKRDICIGAASCLAIAPGTFELDEENKAIVVDPGAHTDEEILLAAQACPTQAIFLYDENGELIYPKSEDRK